MTYYIKFPQESEGGYTLAAFKASYVAETGEVIQESPEENSARDYFLIGTPDNGSRQVLTAGIVTTLEGLYPEIEITTPNEPAGWVPYDPP